MPLGRGPISGTSICGDVSYLSGSLVRSRPITSGFANAILSESAEFVHLLKFDFGSGVVRLNTGSHDLSWDGQSWEAVGGLLEMNGVEETIDGSSQGVDVELSGVDQSILSILLSSQYRGRVAQIYRAHLNQVTGAVVSEPLLMFQGLQLSPYQVTEEQSRNGGTVRIRTRLSGYFGVERKRGIEANTISHSHVYSGETFFQHVPSLAKSKVYWGTTLPRIATRAGTAGRTATR